LVEKERLPDVFYFRDGALEVKGLGKNNLKDLAKR
jgi:hypothetical protein